MFSSGKASPEIVNFVESKKYETEDLSTIERFILEKQKKKPRSSRKDLNKGDFVVLLEGCYAGKKAVFLEQTNNHKAIISGVKEYNNLGLLQIDERYLFKLNVNVNLESLRIPQISFEDSDTDILESKPISDSNIDQTLKAAISKIDFLKAYFLESFKVDHSVEFYSLDY
ncbi:hypothetical protein NUSPORA_00015 [Nucleospora cyclopteri]